MSRFIILIFFISFLNEGLSAQTNLDSLYSVWQDQTQPDSNRTKAYNRYIWNGFLFSNPDTAFILAQSLLSFGENQPFEKAKAYAYNLMAISNHLKSDHSKALDYYQRSLKISEEIGDKKLSANAISNTGIIYQDQGEYPKALEYFQRGLKIREEIGDKKGRASDLRKIGSIYQALGDYPKALEYYQRSLKISEEAGDKKESAGTINSIGVIYYYQEDYPKALDYFQRSLKIKEEIGDKRGSTNSINNIGMIYHDQEDYPKALEYYERSLKIKEEIGDKKGSGNNINNIGSIYKDQGDYLKALEYYERSLKIREEIGDKNGRVRSISNIGNTYKDQGNYPKALEYCKKSLVSSKEIGSLDLEKKACQCLYDTYKFMGMGNEALLYLEKLQVLDDSLKTEETTKKLQQMEFAKVMLADSLNQVAKDIEVQNIRKEEIRKSKNTRNILLGSGLFLLLLAGGFFSRWRYVKKSRDTISKERDRSENLLLNILPAEIAEELKANGEAVARDFDQVSILFTDFKEFTQMSEKLSAKELVAEINHCFKAFDEICEKYNVEKIKTIGDAYMAAGGLPIPTADSVKNTVLAALEMTDFIIKRKVERVNAGQLGFEMRAGIHTGNVVAGIVGVKKFQYDIWGDTVNTASRMESNGEIRRVNISQFTYDIVKDDPQFNFTSRGKVEVKGKGRVEMWFVAKNEGHDEA